MIRRLLDRLDRALRPSIPVGWDAHVDQALAVAQPEVCVVDGCNAAPRVWLYHPTAGVLGGAVMSRLCLDCSDARFVADERWSLLWADRERLP